MKFFTWAGKIFHGRTSALSYGTNHVYSSIFISDWSYVASANPRFMYVRSRVYY